MVACCSSLQIDFKQTSDIHHFHLYESVLNCRVDLLQVRSDSYWHEDYKKEGHAEDAGTIRTLSFHQSGPTTHPPQVT